MTLTTRRAAADPARPQRDAVYPLTIATFELWSPSETFIRQHFERICPRGTAAIYFSQEDPSNLKVPSLQVRRTNLSHLPLVHRRLIRIQNLVFSGYSKALDTDETERIARFLSEHRVQRVLAEYGPTGCLLAPACRKARVPLSVHFHGWDASFALRRWVTRCEYRILARQATHLICPSRFLAENLAQAGLPRSKLEVIPCGVDTDAFKPSATVDAQLVLAVGRLVPKKGPDLTLRAFAQIAERHPHARLEFVGDGPLREECQSLIKNLGLHGRVLLHGATSHEFVRQQVSRAAVFLQHSLTDADGATEGLPVSILEAMASGVPVVSTSHAGIPEAVEHGRTGLLVPEGDVSGMACALDRLLSDPEQRRTMGRRARDRIVRHFSAADQIERLRQLLFHTSAPKSR